MDTSNFFSVFGYFFVLFDCYYFYLYDDDYYYLSTKTSTTMLVPILENDRSVAARY